MANPQPAESVRARGAIIERTRHSISVCIATYRRPQRLSALLESLRRQQDAVLGTLHAVFVIDNDAQRSASDLIDQLRPDYVCPLIYDCVPQRSIALARNRGVQLALKTQSEFIAFVDDDCVASSNWLRELMRVSTEYAADIVWGRVQHEFQNGTPGWLRRAGLYGPTSKPTGTTRRLAETNNVLVRAAILRPMREPFDPAFGLTGGSDTLLFTRAHRAGARIVWADEATVTEAVTPDRSRVRWLLQRAYRTGNAGVFMKRKIAPRLWLPERLFKGGAHLGYGALTVLPALVRGRGALIQSLQRLALACGIFSAIVGIRYVEYRQVDDNQ